MPPKFAVGIRACCVAVALGLATAGAAEPKASLKGATRDQVLARYGEPRSAIVAGNREMLFFATEKITLRDGVVTDVEIIPETPAPAPRAPADDTAASTTGAAPTAAPSAAPVAPTPTAPAATPAPASAQPAPATSPDSSSKLEIKSVRRPGTDYTRPTTKQPSSSSTSAPPSATIVGTVATTPQSSTTTPPSAAPASATTTPAATPAADARAAPSTTPESSVLADRVAKDAPKVDEKGAELSDEEKKAKMKAKAARRRLDLAGLDEEEPPIFTPTTYVIAGLLVGGGLLYIWWRSRQRQLELAATAVSRTPFNAGAAAATAVRFDADLLAKLEWKRFEELVASYYSKTGVIAARTKTGPGSPVHIKISWKGEPRPFAYVQCIPNPAGLIEAAPVQALVAALAADDIRRGYVVTTGKFSVAARDVAEEKSITLLTGDILVEKINALPDGARAELMTETTAGDYTTPSCPKCEAKMVPVPEEPGLFRCAAHPDQTARKTA